MESQISSDIQKNRDLALEKTNVNSKSSKQMWNQTIAKRFQSNISIAGILETALYKLKRQNT